MSPPVQEHAAHLPASRSSPALPAEVERLVALCGRNPRATAQQTSRSQMPCASLFCYRSQNRNVERACCLYLLMRRHCEDQTQFALHVTARLKSALPNRRYPFRMRGSCMAFRRRHAWHDCFNCSAHSFLLSFSDRLSRSAHLFWKYSVSCL